LLLPLPLLLLLPLVVTGWVHLSCMWWHQ
jgi:hypothetical protein